MALTQIDKHISHIVDTVYTTDTVRIVTSEDYQRMLERSNMQLSIWWTAIGVSIGALAVLFTAGAIIATFIIFRQSREYRDYADAAINTALSRYQSVLDSFILEKNQEIREQLDVAIADAEKSLQEAKGENRQQVAAAITEMKQQRDAFLATSDALLHKPFSLDSVPRAKSLRLDRRCERCGGIPAFSGKRDPKTGQWTLRCSACGHEQIA